MANERAFAGGLDTKLSLLEQRIKNLEFPNPEKLVDRFSVTQVPATSYLNMWQPVRGQQFKRGWNFSYLTGAGTRVWANKGTVGINGRANVNGRAAGSVSVRSDGGVSGYVKIGKDQGNIQNGRANVSGSGSFNVGVSSSGGISGNTGAVVTGVGAQDWTNRGSQNISYDITVPQWRALTKSDGWQPWYVIQAHGSLTDLLKLQFDFAGSPHNQIGISVTREFTEIPQGRGIGEKYDGPSFWVPANTKDAMHRVNLEWQHIKPGEGDDPHLQIDSKRWFVVWACSMNSDPLGEVGTYGGGSKTRDRAIIRPPLISVGLMKTPKNGGLLNVVHAPAQGTYRGGDWGIRVTPSGYTPIPA